MTSRSVAAQGGTSDTERGERRRLHVALTTAAEQGVSFTSFNNFNSDCTIASNGTATGAEFVGASVYMGSFNNATMKSV